jgi:hypothetical protein
MQPESQSMAGKSHQETRAWQDRLYTHLSSTEHLLHIDPMTRPDSEERILVEFNSVHDDLLNTEINELSVSF